MNEIKNLQIEEIEKIYVNVLLKDKKFKIFCGDGRQTLRWLSDVSILKYENMFSTKCEVAYGMKLENGEICNLYEKIRDVVKNYENVWVLLKEEFNVFQENCKEMEN